MAFRTIYAFREPVSENQFARGFHREYILLENLAVSQSGIGTRFQRLFYSQQVYSYFDRQIP